MSCPSNKVGTVCGPQKMSLLPHNVFQNKAYRALMAKKEETQALMSSLEGMLPEIYSAVNTCQETPKCLSLHGSEENGEEKNPLVESKKSTSHPSQSQNCSDVDGHLGRGCHWTPTDVFPSGRQVCCLFVTSKWKWEKQCSPPITP